MEVALVEAIVRGDKAAVVTLLDNGVDPNSANESDRPFFTIAATRASHFLLHCSLRRVQT
jgi:ankyrin repeat protein